MRDDARRTAKHAGFGVLAAFMSVALHWGFTVDDALITARVASEIARAGVYRFNPEGPAVDAVTPLGFVWLLVPFAGAGPLGALAAARLIGAACAIGTGALLGAAIGRHAVGHLRWLPLAVLALSGPFGAWAGSGMETPFVTVLASLVLLGGPLAAIGPGLAGALRPELLPWVATVVLGRAVLERRSGKQIWAALAAVLTPALVVMALRLALFGSPAPLSVFAKPSDGGHGLRYALGALLLSGPPWLLVGRWPSRPLTRALAGGVMVHVAALTAAGGDWMPLWRLFVPVLPSISFIAATSASASPRWLVIARTAMAAAVSVIVLVYVSWPGRRVFDDRSALIVAARPLLAGARQVATLDVGWVGAATAAPIMDLAGVTDPKIARLPGGHTSKRIPEQLLISRQVDCLVLLLAPGARVAQPWTESSFARQVEWHVANRLELPELELRGVIPLGRTGQHYVVLRSIATDAP